MNKEDIPKAFIRTKPLHSKDCLNQHIMDFKEDFARLKPHEQEMKYSYARGYLSAMKVAKYALEDLEEYLEEFYDGVLQDVKD